MGGRKLACLARLNAAAAGQLLCVTDQQSGRHFLVDSGTSISLLPHSSKSPTSSPCLLGPDGGDINCWGEQQLHLQFSSMPFTWSFLRTVVAFPILGLDFLKEHSLLLDTVGAQLVQKVLGATVPLC